MRQFLILILVLVASHDCLAQIRRATLEEIKTVATDDSPNWKIGESEFAVNQQTIIHREYPAKVGNLAVVEYIEQNGGKLIATQIQPMPFNVAGMTDGPYVFWKDATTAEIITFADGKPNRQTIKNITEPRELKDLPGKITKITLDPAPPEIPQADWKQPGKLLAISDLEGNYQNALRFLQNNNVIDEDGNWDWGSGHLVLVGDLVDRGPSVTEVMWLMKRLERQAKQSGGHVHYVLGNHEAMVMGGDLRYIHPKYHFISSRIGIPYNQLFGSTSDIGRWWRSKNGVTRIGDLLFVHGGYSPMLDKAKLDMDTLNRRIRNGLHPNRPEGADPGSNPVKHIHGPFWYRGYFPQYAAEWGGLATPTEINSILKRHKAKHVVIGHTVVDQVGPINAEGNVIGIDVKWANSKKCQGLLQENGKLYRLTMTGEREEILAKATK